MTDRSVVVRLRAVTSEFSAEMAKAGLSAKGLATQLEGIAGKSEQSFKKLGMGLLDTGAGTAAVAAGAAIAGAAVLKFAKAGVDSYTELAGQVREFQRASGESAEESSKMVAVANILGVSVDSLASGMFRLSRNVNDHADKLRADGIEVAKSLDGHVNLAGTLENVGAAYQKAGAGAAGNKVLFDAFGRSGLAMIPILNQSKEQLEEFYAAAARHHEILSQDDLDKTFQFKVATRELGEAWTGLERELGAAVLPMLTELASGLTGLIDKGDDLAKHVGGWGNVFKILNPVLSAELWLLKQVTGSTDDHAEAEQKAADASKDAAAALKQYTDALKTEYAAAFGVQEQQDSYNKALIEFADKVKAAQINHDRFATSLDDGTSAGLANREMLRGLVKHIEDVAAAAKTQGVDVGEATAGEINSLLSVLRQMGFNEEQAQQYLALLRETSGNFDAVLTLNTDQAMAKAVALVQEFAQIPAMLASPGLLDARLVVGNQGVPNSIAAPGLIDARQRTGTYTGLPVSPGVGGAIAGHGPSAEAAQKAQDQAAKQGADDAKREQEALASYLEAVWKQHGQILKNTFEMTGRGLDDYVGHLDAELAAEKPYTDEWVRLQQEKEAALTHQAEVLKNVAAMQRAFEDNIHEVGASSNAAYLQQLEDRLAGTQRFSNDWLAIWRQIQQVQQQMSAEDQKAADAAKTALDSLNGLLDQEASLRGELTKLADDHRKALTGIEQSYNTDMAKILDDRRQQLQGWADVTQRVTVQWGNTAAALTGNVRSQIDTFDEWVQALDAARQHGVSDQVVQLLGLDQGPQALGQLRMFTSATSQEIADLNASVADRQKQIDSRVTAEVVSTSSKIAAQLRALAQTHAAQIEAENAQFLAQQRDLNKQLDQLGQSAGRSYGDALATGLLSSLPAVQQAAQKLRDAIQNAQQHASYSTDANALVSLPGGGQVSVGFLASQGAAGYFQQADGSYHVPTDATMVTMAGNVPVSQYGFATSNLPHYAAGVDVVPATGPAVVHAGERIFSPLDNQALIAAVSSIGAQAPVIEVYVDGVKSTTTKVIRSHGVTRATVGVR